jgi:hypothetical protein
MNCKHEHTIETRVVGYSAPVAVHPYTEENPAAHGNICVTEQCTRCGADRLKNINGNHVEYGTWGPSHVEQPDNGDGLGEQMLRKRRISLRSVRGDDVEIIVDQRLRRTTIDSIRAAAEQSDNGDGLVPLYTALLHHIYSHRDDEHD